MKSMMKDSTAETSSGRFFCPGVVLSIFRCKTPPIMPGTAGFNCAMQSTFLIHKPVGPFTVSQQAVQIRFLSGPRSYIYKLHLLTRRSEEFTTTHLPYKESALLHINCMRIFAENQVERGWEEERRGLLFFSRLNYS